MQNETELEAIKRERDYDTEWLSKYKRIIDGLQQIAEINADGCNSYLDDWCAICHGLAVVSKLMQEDINGRKENNQ